jgi:hypothetical protein
MTHRSSEGQSTSAISSNTVQVFTGIPITNLAKGAGCIIYTTVQEVNTAVANQNLIQQEVKS